MERSNTYIFTYSIILVVIVAAVLSFTAFSLKDKQTANVKKEKMQNILTSIKVNATSTEAQDLYNTYIKETFILNAQGQSVPYLVTPNGKAFDTITAFDIDMKVLYSMKPEERTLPVFKAVKNDSTFVIIPLRGKGLWGPIWGYISLSEDLNTVYGAVFDHQGETPGLGAEIKNLKFQAPFVGKQIFDESGKFVSIKVQKGGAAPGDIHAVDAISGGTITSNGVNAMIETCLGGYVTYLQSNK